MENSNFLNKFNKKIGFLKPGWWILHFLGISIVYMLGHFIWG